MSEKAKCGFVIVPHRGGTFSVYTSLRSGLKKSGVDLEWIGISPTAERIARDPLCQSFEQHGRLFDSTGASVTAIGQSVLRHIEERGYSSVFVNVLTTPIEMSVAAYLPAQVARIGVVHNITPGTYSAAKALRPFLHSAVGVSPRIRDDLITLMGYSPLTTHTIFNALDLSPYESLPSRKPDATLRLLSLGRIVDTDKGIFWLPKIVELLGDLRVHLTVAGDGRDLPKLKELSAHLGDRITFLGRVDPTSVPLIMASHDVFVMPSRFEGFGYTLIEAMAARCVPVVSQIRGVTDSVVDEGRTGLLFPVGDSHAAAMAIRKLASDLELRHRMSEAGRASVHERFSDGQMGRAYLNVIEQTHASLPNVAARPSGDFQLVPIGGRWRRFVPNGIKNKLRTWMYRR